MKKIAFIFAIILSQYAQADTALCKIEIEDINKGSTKYTVEQKFSFTSDGPANRKFFETPGNDYKCTLAFFDLKTGTMLSCGYLKDAERTFFQSDRSGVKESPANNMLSFRHNKAFISLKAHCK